MKPISLALLPVCVAALSFGTASQAAAPTTQGKAHFLLLDAQEAPMAGATLAGACQARLGPFWNAQKYPTRWSCTSDADGVCIAELTTLAAADGKPVECSGTERSTITEKGAQPAAISYHAFFPRGVPASYAVLKKVTSWKDGGYVFKSMANQAAFASLAYRFRTSHYASALQASAAAGSTPAVLSTRAAHHQESSDFPNATYLTAQRDPASGQLQLRVVVELSYVDYTFHRYQQAHFEGAQGKQSAALTPLSDKTLCNLRDVMERKCTYRETLEFPLDAALARQIAARYQPGAVGSWPLSITSNHGHERALPIPYAEFAALLQAYDHPGQRSP